MLTKLVNHSSSTDDSTDEPIATERGRKKIKSKKEGTERKKIIGSSEPGKYHAISLFLYKCLQN